MRKKTLYIVAVIFCCISLNTYAQTGTSKNSFTVVNYKLNVNAPLTNQEKQQLEEVYSDQLQKYVLNNPQRLKDIKNILRNRVFIIELPNHKKESKLLSKVSLFNNYNKSLRRKRFNENNFNPLKYNFDFYSKGTKMYRVDHTNYYIVIKSQYQQ